MIKSLLCLLMLCISNGFIQAQSKVLTLNNNWLFREHKNEKWYFASVPGSLHADLLNSNLITDPFFSDTEKDLQWIEQKEWDYKTVFSLDKSFLLFSKIELEFEGLDTYASVKLNDSVILNSANMFRSYTIDVKRLLKVGKNTLLVHFYPAVKKGLEAASQLSYALPEGERSFTRKAQFQYGWDFGPRFVGCGIWKNVSLNCFDKLKIESLQYKIIDCNDSVAHIQFNTRIHCDSAATYSIVLQSLFNPTLKKEAVRVSKMITLSKGLNYDSSLLTIKQPRLWWCNGMGEAFLYHFRYLISTQQNKALDKQQVHVGIRKIELVQQPDTIGTSFYFKINNKAVFMKGSNVIPMDVFLSRKTGVDEQKLVLQAKQCNMNLLRVWGGGVYASEDFYNSCDRFGILVWQDLMFACAMVPGDNAFLENVKIEVQQQIERLQKHPSLALWCGNNESDEAWKNWGWQKQYGYSTQDSIKIWKDYQQLFEKLLPELMHAHSPETNYISSSPTYGWGRKESYNHGDSHYWGVWWGNQPFETYREKTGRFVSEYGFQSLPDFYTLKQFSDSTQLNLAQIFKSSHQKHKTGFETINHYLKQHYNSSDSLKNYIYQSQLLQRDGMKMAIEAHRTAKPKCMGTLFWQLNDCWPGITWSALDYYSRPKALYYYLNKGFANTLIHTEIKKDAIEITLINDSLHNYSGILILSLKNFSGKVLYEQKMPVDLENVKNVRITLPLGQLPAYDSTNCYLAIKLKSASKSMAESIAFFTKPKYLKLPKASLKIDKLDERQYSISSDVFAKDIYLYTDEGYTRFSDNYFSLESGSGRVIQLLNTSDTLGPTSLKYLVLNNL